ncbi:hypothetical protein V6N13_050442 [Hibiscus sabdariffa]
MGGFRQVLLAPLEDSQVGRSPQSRETMREENGHKLGPDDDSLSNINQTDQFQSSSSESDEEATLSEHGSWREEITALILQPPYAF